MTMDCFGRMTKWRKKLALISSRDHYKSFSQLQSSDTPQVWYETSQNLSLAYSQSHQVQLQRNPGI